MAVFNAAKREIDIKIVYYGPALCGKTTNVQCVHKMLAPHQRGDIMSLATKDDRNLFFDFLPIELGDVKGFKTRFHIYTVPGQVYYALTRRAVLTGVDGVVFVADSQADKTEENVESLKDLQENLKYYKKDLSVLPFIIQYNKRDLDNILPINELNENLNTMNVPYYGASAVDGTGVVETLTACCKLVLKQMDSKGSKRRRRAKAEEPGPVEPPVAQSVSAPEEDADEPIIKIINDGTPLPADDSAVAPGEVGEPPAEPFDLEESAAGGGDLAAPSPDATSLDDAAPVEPLNLDDAASLEPLCMEDVPAPDPLNVGLPPDEPGQEPVITMDSSPLPDLDAPPDFSAGIGVSDEMPSVGLNVEGGEGLEVVRCEDPQKGAAGTVVIPVVVKEKQTGKESVLSITIKIEGA